MANWYGSARSNYFAVKDLEAFRTALKHLDVQIVGARDDNSIGEDGRVGLLVGGDGGGWPGSYYDEEHDVDVDVDLSDLVAEHLADGEVAVLIECGAEKLRYLSGVAIAVNNRKEHRTISLDAIYGLATELGPNVTEAVY